MGRSRASGAVDVEVVAVTAGVHCLRRRRYLSCCYAVELAGGVVMVDSGIDPEARDVRAGLARLGRRLEDVTAVLVTHWHNDHSSGVSAIREAAGARVYYHRDAEPRMTRVARATGLRRWLAERLPGDGALAPLRGLLELAPGRAAPATRLVADGELVEGAFRVVETPGHECGHVSYHLERDGVLFAGDALAVAGDHLTFMSRFLTADRMQGRRSMLRCLDLQPRVVCPGHRRPLVVADGTAVAAFRARVERLRWWPIVGR